jgi:sugar phosphate isomerase/epimerase
MSSAVQSLGSRREFLQWTAAAGAAVLSPIAVQAADSDPYAGFKMGLQSYSLRGFKDPKVALQHTQKLGLKYWESFRNHIPMDTAPEKVEAAKAMLKEYGVTLLAFGVEGFNDNEGAARKAFDFAKAMGVMSISADPKKDKATFDLLDKLVAEYDIAIAIHNHGPKASYDKVTDVQTWVKDRHPKIGACVDTGHYLRSDEDPVEVIEKLGKRVFGVHLKDVKNLPGGQKKFTILGEGDLRVADCLKALKKLDYKYSLSLEYEESPDNPIADIELSLKTVREAVKKIG